MLDSIGRIPAEAARRFGDRLALIAPGRERPFHREADQATRDLADSLRHYEIRLQAETKEAAREQAQLGVLT